MPKVSIGMPVYNGEEYIKEALNSLLAQTFTDFELIISDNCSTDGTATICASYAANDARIKYIRQTENIGAVANFEFVLHAAHAKYFMWAAHDDRWMVNFLEKTVAILDTHQDCGLAFSNFKVRNLETGAETLHQVVPSNHSSMLRNFMTRTLNMCPSLIYGLHRIDTIKNMTLPVFDFADIHFIAEIALKTHIQIIDDYLYIAGTKGIREPYSLTHTKINRTNFLYKQYELLKNNVCFPLNYCLFLLVCLVMANNKLKLWRY